MIVGDPSLPMNYSVREKYPYCNPEVLD